MDIRVDGSRSTSENWLIAHQLPVSELPSLTQEELKAASSFGITPEAYARSRHAADLTDIELEMRAKAVAKWVERWLIKSAPNWCVTEIFFKTFEGKFRLTLNSGTEHKLVFISEELVDNRSMPALRMLQNLWTDCSVQILTFLKKQSREARSANGCSSSY